MKLRTRLIVAFLLLSVVPLGAVTFYSYRSNVRALETDGAHEADMMAGALSQRMQLVTSRLSEKVEQLMNMPQTPAQVVRVAETKPAPAAPPETESQFNGRIADVLGETAIFLNNVELPDVWTFGPGGPNASGGSGRQGPRNFTGAPRSSQAGAPGAATVGRGTAVVTAGKPPDPSPPSPPRAGQPPGDSGSPRRGAGPRTAPAGVAGSSTTPPISDRIKVDLAPIRRDLYRQIVPGGHPEALTAEERQRVTREVNQRMLGIVEGIKISAAELQKQAAAARTGSANDVKSSQQMSKAADAMSKMAANMEKPPAPPAEPPSPVPAAPVTRKTLLTGDRLDVTIEQNGKVLRKMNAEVNLPNILATVFSTTPHEQGEVPFAVGKDGHIYTAKDEDHATIEGLGAVAKPDGPLGATVLPEWIVVTTQDPTGSGLRFGIARPVGESLTALRQSAGRNAGFGLLFIGAAIVGIVPLSSRLTRNLSTLNAGVTRIAQGDYGARVTVKANDEFGDLAKAFNRMAADVEEHQRLAIGQERIKRELELGRQIQHDMLPREPLRFGLSEIQGVSVPAREVGGDFFNYFALPSGHVALLVGDVSGKGVGAALLMANIQASLRTRFALGQDLSAIANEIDRDIAGNSPGEMYATLFLGILDPQQRALRYVNAGHNPQFILRRQGGLERMPSTGLPVGMVAGRGYGEVTVSLAQGDLVFFYTDGCVETENEAGEMFGTDRLEPLLLSVHAEGADNVLARVERALEDFRGARELYDDATMMAVRIG